MLGGLCSSLAGARCAPTEKSRDKAEAFLRDAPLQAAPEAQQRPEPIAVFVASKLVASADAIFVRVEEGIPPLSSQQNP